MPQVDPTILVPHWALGDALRVVVYFLATAWIPGVALCRLVGWRPACRAERWALAAVVGTLWTALAYFGLGLLGWQRWHLIPTGLPVVAVLARWTEDRLIKRKGRRLIRSPVAPPWTRWEAAGLVLVGLLTVWHVVRVDRAVVYDDSGLKLYGAWYSDKLVNMSPAAALMDEVPPRSLRMAGEPFPYHFFPHIFVAAAARDTGVDFVNVFWFHAAAIGIVVSGLAVIGFCRRLLGSYAMACLGLAFFGLAFFTTEMRPLDLSIPWLLTGISAIDRWLCGRRSRWAVLALVAWGAMPVYELFHGFAALAGLGVWWAATVLMTLVRRRKPVPGGQPANRSFRARTLLVVCALLAVLGSLKLTMLGARVVWPTRFLVKSSYRDSFKHRWKQFVERGGSGAETLATIQHWREPARDDPHPPGIVRRAVGEVLFDIGLLGYVFAGFVNVALAGILALLAVWRSRRPGRPVRRVESYALVAAVALFGLAMPAAITWGHQAGGQWWETPNIYRPATLAWLLLVLVGPPVIVGAVRNLTAARPTPWARTGYAVLLLIAGWQGFVLVRAAVAGETSFHLVDRDRLAGLAFLRSEVPFGQIVIHPWSNEAIRNVRDPDAIDWIYKRHFTLGSNLAGQRMWYEGREDHLFIGGFIHPDKVYHRRDVRRRFYESPDDEVLEEVLGPGGVQWVVADVENPAPSTVRSSWPVAYSNATVTIYRRPR